MEMMDLGGHELVMEKNELGETALHCACAKKTSTEKVIMKMINEGGRQLVMEKNKYGLTALYYATIDKPQPKSCYC